MKDMNRGQTGPAGVALAATCLRGMTFAGYLLRCCESLKVAQFNLHDIPSLYSLHLILMIQLEKFQEVLVYVTINSKIMA